jgi:hypothetical protein
MSKKIFERGTILATLPERETCLSTQSAKFCSVLLSLCRVSLWWRLLEKTLSIPLDTPLPSMRSANIPIHTCCPRVLSILFRRWKQESGRKIPTMGCQGNSFESHWRSLYFYRLFYPSLMPTSMLRGKDLRWRIMSPAALLWYTFNWRTPLKLC